MEAEGPGAAAQAPAPPPGDSRQLLVPPPRPGVLHFCIEYPGYVADEAKVLETLGGAVGIARQLQVRGRGPPGGGAANLLAARRQKGASFEFHWRIAQHPSHQQENPKQLALRLRPRDVNCHPAHGARQPCRRMLLKLTRPAGGGGGGSAGQGGWSAEVVAALPHTYRFTTPADYQYVAHDSRPAEEQGAPAPAAAQTPPAGGTPLLWCCGSSWSGLDGSVAAACMPN